jgi:hypothetical protein
VTDETRARFLAAIAAQIPIERIAEVHLFPAIRQGGMESGVAVIAVEWVVPAEPAPELAKETAAESTTEPTGAPAIEPPLESATEPPVENDAEDGPIEPSAPPAPQRYTIFSARYRHTLKGPDRGKWEVGVTEEADAPLLTVDAVVRGVQRRSGDADEIVRLSGDEVRGALAVSASS